MLRNAFHVAIHNPSSLVFVAVVISSFVMASARAKPPLTGTELLNMAALGAVYSIIGTLVFWTVIATGSVKYKSLYLAIQFILGMVIMQLARGSGWLVMLPIVSHSVVLFSPREAVIPCLLILAGMSWNASQTIVGWMSFLQWFVVLSSIVLFAAIFTNLAMREAHIREQAEKLTAQLEEANQKLKAYAEKVEEMTAIQERNRMAREIHDGLGHYLTAMNMQAKVVSALIGQNPGQAQEALGKLQGMITGALADVRRSIAALRNDGIAGKHLPEALLPLNNESREAGLTTELVISGEARPLSPEMELAIYRAIQEGLTNVLKHAQASQVTMKLEYRPRAVFLQIRDNGVGRDLGQEEWQGRRDSYGLLGLRERVQILGGEIAIKTEPGAGFCLEITLPET